MKAPKDAKHVLSCRCCHDLGKTPAQRQELRAPTLAEFDGLEELTFAGCCWHCDGLERDPDEYEHDHPSCDPGHLAVPLIDAVKFR